MAEFDSAGEHLSAPRSRPDPVRPPARPADLATAGNSAFAGLVRRVQRRELGTQGAGPLDPDIAAAIEVRRGGGVPLTEPVRADMEHHLGVDLSAVRIHTGPDATRLNRAVQAEAFTTGTDLFFGGDSYDPVSSRGRELLAHELTHVVQQSTGAIGTDSGVSHPDDPAEVRAREVGRAAAAAAGPSVDRSAAPEETLPE